MTDLGPCSCQTWHLWDVELTSRALCGPSSFCWDAVFARVCTFDCAFCVERCASVLLCVLHSACRRLCFCARCVRRLAKSQALPIPVQGQVFFSSDSGDNTLLYVSLKSEFFLIPHFLAIPKQKERAGAMKISRLWRWLEEGGEEEGVIGIRHAHCRLIKHSYLSKSRPGVSASTIAFSM